MRQIKFRAFIPSAKIMINEGLEIGTTEYGKGSLIVNTQLQKGEALKGLIWMQFTGLTDKNGKKIYEGDLFDCIYNFDGCDEHILEVVWNNEYARFQLKSHGECHQSGVSKTMSDLKRLKIIGNVFENPELLNLSNSSK